MKKFGILSVVFLLATVTMVQAVSDSENTQLQTTVQDVLTIVCDGVDGQDTVNLGNLTPGTPVTGSTDCVVTTNGLNGYSLKIEQDGNSGLTTMDLATDASVDITDKTAWDKTASLGNGNAAAYSGTGLGFGVLSSTATKSTTWWGTGTTCSDSNQKYAGFPLNGSSNNNIMEHSSYSSGSTTTTTCYKLDVPATQKAGVYNGIVTYTATTN